MADARDDLMTWILDGEDWLMARVLMYAKRQGYAEYTSTLEEAWRLSIQKLSQALNSPPITEKLTEFFADESFGDDPVSAFAVLEAHKHRERGIDLKMFLGLFKYYRQAYLDRVERSGLGPQALAGALFRISRLFDRMEIAFCSEWADLKTEDQLTGLKEQNRQMTNEKNRFLTVTESLASPVILLDSARRISYVNLAAAPILNLSERPGRFYYQGGADELEIPPWLDALLDEAAASTPDWSGEHKHRELGSSVRVFSVTIRPMLDVSDKFHGTVVILHDITALRAAEQVLAGRADDLERLSYTDSLTGVLNRRGLFARAESEMEIARLSGKRLNLLYGDVDNLKAINDHLGHSVGDQVLVAFAEALRRGARASDLVSRIGGDEFVVVFPHSDDLDCDLVERRIAQHFDHVLGTFKETLQVSVSLGWALFEPTRHDTLMDLLADADDSMYLSKQRRRGLPKAAEPPTHSRA